MSIPPPARAERREEQHERFAVLQGILRDRPDAAARNVQNVKADQPVRIAFCGYAADGVNGNSDDGPTVAPTFIRVGR